MKENKSEPKLIWFRRLEPNRWQNLPMDFKAYIDFKFIGMDRELSEKDIAFYMLERLGEFTVEELYKIKSGGNEDVGC